MHDKSISYERTFSTNICDFVLHDRLLFMAKNVVSVCDLRVLAKTVSLKGPFCDFTVT